MRPVLPDRQFPAVSGAAASAVARWIAQNGFHPYAWVWIYQSEYLIINVIPWFAKREDLLAVRGFALLSLISFCVFLLFPIRQKTAGQQPECTGC